MRQPYIVANSDPNPSFDVHGRLPQVGEIVLNVLPLPLRKSAIVARVVGTDLRNGGLATLTELTSNGRWQAPFDNLRAIE